MSAVLNKDSAFERSPRKQQDVQHRWIADKIYRDILGNVQVRRVDESPIDESVGKALDILGVDFHIVFPNGTLLSGQEKFLSHNCAQYRTVTISEHSWKHCAAQLYFCGYLTADGKGFVPWILLNWPSVIMATANKGIDWQLTPSKGSYPSFYHTLIDTIPANCIIAGNRNR
jgi:hypothetical protein